ncbi:MAG: L-asparaginase/GlutRNAGln amidotransferase subunit [Deltaproteobacteria bacterium]|jgi:glycine reductase|nr:L-asparaginase/GlutRNAGln amidotransferase subunit [Deltaproteobacteria bacterium]
MKLEMQEYEVRDVRFGKKTAYAKGVLTINKDELLNYISTDARLEGMDVGIAKPGEETRIVNVLELTEPRIKPDTGDYYPGMLAPLGRAGQGTTNVLKNVAVLECGFATGLFGGLLDMTGPASLLTPYAKRINVCISAEPASSANMKEYGLALKQAGMKTGVYLAKATVGMTPGEVKTYDLARDAKSLAGLPRVAYLYQLHNHGEAREPFIYGHNSEDFFSTILHPNEIIDGAIVSFHYNTSTAIKNPTYTVTNHPVILDLYRRHGKEINFVGVVIAPEPPSLTEKKRIALMSATLLKEVLNAEGVIVSKEGGGHTDVDIMENCEQCEKLGIRTVLLDNEFVGPDGTGELPIICITSSANAMVSVGNFEETIELPGMKRVIGGTRMPDIVGEMHEKRTIPVSLVAGAISQVGFTYLRTEVW